MRNRLLSLASALLLSSCATSPPPQPEDSTLIPLPAETSFNPEAGRGGRFLVTLHLEDGEPLVFGVDTGCPITLFDRSLSAKLGKSRGKTKFRFVFHKFEDAEIYGPPKLFLGDTQLRTGIHILTTDVRSKSSTNIDGILGMDCLHHYCLQLDFQNNKLRFLAPDTSETNSLGKTLPMILKKTVSDGYHDGTIVSVSADLFQKQNINFRIDTGFSGDGDLMLRSSLFRNLIRNHKPTDLGHWAGGGKTGEGAFFSTFEFAGNTYSNAVLLEFSEYQSFQGLIGLRFLGRHLVTLNFPKSVMYLNQTSAEPLVPSSGH